MPLQVRNLMQVDQIVAGKCCGDAFNCWLEIDDWSMGSCPGKSVLYINFVWLGYLIRTSSQIDTLVSVEYDLKVLWQA
jgi:hypothetical protein